MLRATDHDSEEPTMARERTVVCEECSTTGGHDQWCSLSPVAKAFHQAQEPRETTVDPRKAYWVEERLIGAASYLVYANTKSEAEQAVRGGRVEMFTSKIDHTHRFKTRRAKSEDRR